MACFFRGHLETLDYIFDIFSLLLSLADIITDYLVAYQYYTTDKTIFFILASSELILVQFIYAAAFTKHYVKKNQNSCGKKLFITLCVLPISPFFSTWVLLDKHGITHEIQRYFNWNTFDEYCK